MNCSHQQDSSDGFCQRFSFKDDLCKEHYIEALETILNVQPRPTIDSMGNKFALLQQEVIDNFKTELSKAANSAIQDLYTDVTIHAEGDFYLNYKQLLRDEIKQSFVEEIVSANSHYSWAHEIRMEILEKYPNIIQLKIIADLQEKIASLQSEAEQLRRMRDRY